MKRFLIAALISIALSSAAYAEGKRHPEFDRFEKEDGGHVEYLGNAHGVDAWLLKTKSGQPKFAYTTQEGGLLLGVLVGPDGKIVKPADYAAGGAVKPESGTSAAAPRPETAQKPEEKAPAAAKPAKPEAASKVERLYAEIEKAAWVAVGAPEAPPLYMFVNVNCDHCQAFWKDLTNAIKSGVLQVRVIPFGKAEANREGGAALLSVKDPQAAWNAYIGGDREALGKGKVAAGALAKIDANTALVDKWKMQGPPFSIYRKQDNGVLTAIVGRPKNPMVVVADLMDN